MVGDFGDETYADDVLGACFCGKHAEDAGTASDVEDCFSSEEVAVIDDGGAIGSRPDGVLEHFFVDT